MNGREHKPAADQIARVVVYLASVFGMCAAASFWAGGWGDWAWIVGGLLAVPAFIRLREIGVGIERGQAGLCPACGYDLRASPDRCPECGAAVPAGRRIRTGDE